jgi:hypothetical protein
MNILNILSEPKHEEPLVPVMIKELCCLYLNMKS